MKICHFSDTRGLHSALMIRDILQSDVVICSGNVTNDGNYEEFASFINWFIDIPVKHKVFIAGNRDYCLQLSQSSVTELINKFRNLPGNYYLKGQSCTIDGKKIYGSPNSMYHTYANDGNVGENTFVMYNEQQAVEEWRKIPTDTNVLITNAPPFDILDTGINNNHIGIVTLRDRVEELPDLALHCFGRAFDNGLYDTYQTRFSNGNVLSKPSVISYRANMFQID